MRRENWLTILFLVLTGLALLGMGSLQARQNYLTRGFVEGMPQPINGSGVRLGLNVNLTQYAPDELDSNLQAITELGVTHLKQSFYFTDDFDWAESDRIVAAASPHNFTLVPLLDGDPATDFAPPDLTAYAAWTGEFAARYGDQINHYIIWDEPNITLHWGHQPVNANEYAALLTAAANAIRSADSEALILAAPLAPTVEMGPDNLADPTYLKELYEAGAAAAFDIVMAKPYGFNDSPLDRTTDIDRLNFNRAILLREVMLANGDGHKAIWAGNWGWNSLPADWTGDESIWGEADEASQAEWIVAGLERARREWPWMGVMFLENWEPNAPADDAHWGFSIADQATNLQTPITSLQSPLAYPGFHLAQASGPGQSYEGGWRFSPEFGADISQSGDRAMLHFWGSDIALRVRRADFRARLYIEVDGQPANALPHDEKGTALVLTSPDPAEDYIATELIATNLGPGPHTLTLVADRGWDQWALHGFSVKYEPPTRVYTWGMIGLGAAAALTLILTIYHARKASWGALGQRLSGWYNQLNQGTQFLLTLIVGIVVGLSGWLTWGAPFVGPYRRLGDGTQLMVTAAAAVIFYVAPSFFIYLPALLTLFILITLRPAWGIALIAFTAPFHLEFVKTFSGYQFALVEIFTYLTLGAFIVSRSGFRVSSFEFQVSRSQSPASSPQPPITQLPNYQLPITNYQPLDLAVLALVAIATLSLFFTERLDVATNEWRVLIISPALFYLVWRQLRPTANEVWLILDAFILGGLAVGLIGLWEYATGSSNLITAEGGLLRLRSVYGSPNNVALYLGRVLPLLVAMGLMGQGRRRWWYAAAAFPIALAILLTFSKGGLFLGVPAALLVIFILWQRANRRRAWPWVLGALGLGLIGFLIALQIPQLAGRLNPQGETGIFRLNLWQSSVQMYLEHPWFGVGLDNFLYAYRGRYILNAAWQEPNLNHPHNLILDFATRLGTFGLLVGLALFYGFFRAVRRAWPTVPAEWRPIVIGLAGALAHMLAHGLVDHSFFLVDLAYAFYLLAGLALWLNQTR